MNEDQPTQESTIETFDDLPLYNCHKQVRAAKIMAIDRGAGLTPSGAMLVFDDPNYAPIEVSAEYMTKHNPQVDGYFVVYKDGYQSFSPAAAFEEGYTPALIS